MRLTPMTTGPSTNQFIFTVGTQAVNKDNFYLYMHASGNDLQSFWSSNNVGATTLDTNDDFTVGAWSLLYHDWTGTAFQAALGSAALAVGTRPAVVGDISTSNDINIGHSATPALQFNGLIGPVAIFSRPLTAKERAILAARSTWTLKTLRGRFPGRLTPI
jgi:hypothetical protein